VEERRGEGKRRRGEMRGRGGYWCHPE